MKNGRISSIGRQAVDDEVKSVTINVIYPNCATQMQAVLNESEGIHAIFLIPCRFSGQKNPSLSHFLTFSSQL